MADHLAHSDLYRQVSKEEAQQLANEGEVVIAAQKNPDPTKSGHVAAVRPEGIAEDTKIKPGSKEPLINNIGNFNFATGYNFCFDRKYQVHYYTPRRF